MQVIQRGLTYMRPYLGLAIGAFVSMLIVTATNLYTPQLIQQLIDDGIEAQDWNGIIAATIGLLVVAIVRGIFNYTNAYWAETSSQGVAYDLRNEVFTKLENLSFSYHDTHNVGQLMTRTTSDVEGVRNFFAQGILQLISALITFIGSAAILFLTDWRLALAAVSVIPVIIGIFAYIFGQMGPLFGRVQKNLGLLNNVLQENIEGVRVIKGFTAESRELAKYTAQNQQLYNENINVIKVFSTGFPTVFLMANIATLIVIWYGGSRVVSEALSLGTLVAFNSYLTYLVQPIFQLGMISQQLARAQASGSRIFEVLDAVEEIKNPANPIQITDNTKGHIRFNDVHFHYPGIAQGTLYDISFEAKPGDTIALLGPTGSGKSSIVNLLPRFYDVTEGSVTIDGKDVRQFDLDSLRHEIGICLQNVQLMKGSIRDNIRYGKPEATQEEVEEAARIAQAHDFIITLPNQYDTDVGEGGSSLSGGQRQRVAIARTLLVQPSMLIFDDSMSAVDAETEVKLRQALRPFLTKLTAFIIAQRISTVREATLILVIDNGRIIAQGTHKELLKSSPYYADIVHSQLEAS
ncbi:MAG: ABC transporter ATP-binding protein [Chloroflexota bacterium]